MAERTLSNEQKFNRLKEAAKHGRLPYEQDWWLNVAFYLGHQYSEWSPVDNNIRQIAAKSGQEDAPRPVINKINQFVNKQHAFSQQNKPVPDAYPTNDDPIAQSEANVALAYCMYSADVAKHEEVEELAAHWALVAGTSFKKWTWDPVKKRPAVQALTPFDVFLDPYATTWEDVRYVIHQRFMDPEEVYNVWGVEVKRKAEKTDETKSQYLRGMGLAPVVEGVTVNELWHKPSRRHPEGIFAVWAGDQPIVASRDLPYKNMAEQHMLPFTIQGVLPRPGTPYYDAFVKYLRSPQMEINKRHAQHLMMYENFANLKWFEPEEANLSTPITNHAFQVLKGSGAVAKPEIIAPPAMPSLDADWLSAEMNDVAGLHEVSQGSVPGRVESAKAIEALKEADATSLAVLSSTTSRGIADGFWLHASYAHEFEKESKMIAIYSDDGINEVKEFRAGDLDLGIRFKVTMGTGLGYSRAGRAENLYNLWDRGLLQDDPSRMLQLLDVGGNLPLSSDARDVKLARNENYDLDKGIALKANSYDNHQIHLREHNDRRKSVSFKLLPMDAQKRYEFHCKMHETLMASTLNQEAMYSALSQGAGLGGPPGGDPAAGGAPPEGGPPPEEGASPEPGGGPAPPGPTGDPSAES